MTSRDREIQDTLIDREAVHMIADVLGRLPARPGGAAILEDMEAGFDTAPIVAVDRAWTALAHQLLTTEIETFNAVEKDLERMAAGGGNLSAEAGARALQLYAHVVDFRFDPAFTSEQTVSGGD